MASFINALRLPEDKHDLIMAIRAAVQILVFIAIFFLDGYLPFLENLKEINYIRAVVLAGLIFSIVFGAIVIYRRKQERLIDDIASLEIIVDSLIMIWLIFLFGGMNGPFFFLYFLVLMEAAFTMKTSSIIQSAMLGAVSLAGEYFIFGIALEGYVSASSLLAISLRMITLVLIGYYGFTFVENIIRERRAVEENKELIKSLRQAKFRIEGAYQLERKSREALERSIRQVGR